MEKIAKGSYDDHCTDLEDAVPGSFINSRPMIAVMREFFGTNQLSQFMDQSNPLSELCS
jgi:DNA-directed RNA polymerase subunit beta